MASRTAQRNADAEGPNDCAGNLHYGPEGVRVEGTRYYHCRHCPGDHIAMICHWGPYKG